MRRIKIKKTPAPAVAPPVATPLLEDTVPSLEPAAPIDVKNRNAAPITKRVVKLRPLRPNLTKKDVKEEASFIALDTTEVESGMLPPTTSIHNSGHSFAKPKAILRAPLKKVKSTVKKPKFSMDDCVMEWKELHPDWVSPDVRFQVIHIMSKSFDDPSHWFSVVAQIEHQVYSHYFHDSKRYRDRLILVLKNLKRDSTLIDQYGAKTLALLDSIQLNRGTALEHRQQMDQQLLARQQSLLHSMEASGFTKCDVCESADVDFFSAYTRGIDEPATVFYRCLNQECKHRWSIN